PQPAARRAGRLAQAHARRWARVGRRRLAPLAGRPMVLPGMGLAVRRPSTHSRHSALSARTALHAPFRTSVSRTAVGAVGHWADVHGAPQKPTKSNPMQQLQQYQLFKCPDAQGLTEYLLLSDSD